MLLVIRDVLGDNLWEILTDNIEVNLRDNSNNNLRDYIEVNLRDNFAVHFGDTVKNYFKRQAYMKLSKICKICHLLHSLWNWKIFQSYFLKSYFQKIYVFARRNVLCKLQDRPLPRSHLSSWSSEINHRIINDCDILLWRVCACCFWSLIWPAIKSMPLSVKLIHCTITSKSIITSRYLRDQIGESCGLLLG